MTPTLITADRLFGAPGADAVLVDRGRIAEIGRSEELRPRAVVEERFAGATLLPGLRDAHFHPVGYAGALRRLVVKEAPDFDTLIASVRAAASDLPAGEPLIGVRLDDESLMERSLPTRFELDQAANDRPVLLYRYCGHIAVANTAALEAAGVGPDTVDPVGGSLDRSDDGIPNGVLRETAIALVTDPIGDRSRGLEPGHVAEATRHLAAAGLTSLGAIVSVGTGLWCEGAGEMEVLLAAAPELALPMRVLVATEDPRELGRAATAIADAGRRLEWAGVKLFADGSLGGHTAEMFDGYADRPDQRGTNRLDEAAAIAVAEASLDLGGAVAIHAIGDASVHRVLGVFARLIEAGADPAMLRMEHVSVITDDDLAWMAELGITASVQPAFLASEADWLETRLGPARLRHTYPFKTMARAGIRLAGGSDCPVEPPHPLWGLAAAVDRGGIVPGERLTVGESLSMFTSGAAAAMGQPDPLAVGSPAHLTVVADDVERMDAAALRNADVLMTFVEGETPPLPVGAVDWQG
jgi:predicted amidohydrolase YtcJ